MGPIGRTKSTRLLANSSEDGSAPASRVPITAIFFAVLFVMTVTGVVYGWGRWGKTVVARPVYRIAPENLRVTPSPAWIRSDVRAEVIRDGALNDLTIFDKDVTIRVYQAFELHPWVAKVKRVSKHPPARLDIDLEYRQPVAWVEVPSGILPGNDGGVIPVDQYAIVLPSRDFTQEHVADYLRISVPGLTPCGLAGTPWGDPHVAGAAQIAALLNDSWREIKLFRIRLCTDPELVRRENAPIYELETKGHRRIIWGIAPAGENSSEPPPPVKLSRLRQLVESVGDLDQAPEAVWDLRNVETIPSNRTARAARPFQTFR